MIISLFCIETNENGGGIYIYIPLDFSQLNSHSVFTSTLFCEFKPETLLNRGDMPAGYRLRITYINHKRLGDH